MIPAFTKGLEKKKVITVVRFRGRASNRYIVHHEEPLAGKALNASPVAGPVRGDVVPCAGAQTDQESNQPIEQLKERDAPPATAKGPNAAELAEAIEQWNVLAGEYGLETVSHKGLFDLFRMPQGRGAGVWALREPETAAERRQLASKDP